MDTKGSQVDKDRAKGMLWGLIVGDALGSPIQWLLTAIAEGPIVGLIDFDMAY